MCNKKVVGIALLVIGIVLIAIGIIIGLLLPSIAFKEVEKTTCVNSKDSAGYERWKGPTYFTNRVYIWNITNKDGFLYRQEKPKLEEKGPYIYTTKSEKVDVKFENDRVTSKTFDKAKFNKTLTDKECPKCNENDQLTVLNAAYLGLIAKVGSAKDFGTAFIPLILILVFHALDGKTTNRNNTLLLMGKSQTDKLEFPSTATLAFGSWINSNPDPLRNATFGHLKRNYSLQEMSGLYGALTDSTFLPFTNAALLARCTNKNNPFLSKDCGLAINLGIYADPNVNQNVKLLVAPWIQSFLCPHASSCYNTTNNQAAIPAVAAFIAGPLPRFVLQYLENNNYGLTTTRNQSEIILGYLMDKLHLPPPFPSVIRVPGPVTSYNNETEAKARGKNSTFYTCESTEQRFTYAAIDGKTQIDPSLYPNATEDQLKVRGYYIQFPGQKSLKPCKTGYSRLASRYELFLTEFSFAVNVSHTQDVELHGIPMHRYTLDKSALDVNNVTVFTKGVFDVSRVSGGPLFFSLPRFLHGGSLHEELDLPAPEEKKHESFLSIEPISGSAMDLKLRLQLNGMILNTSIYTDYQPQLNVTFLNKLFPIWWSEKSGGIDKETAETFRSKLFGSLQLSCGLLVALPVIGGILLMTGVVLIVLAIKKSSSVTTA
ncbi:unnamed protein product [Porites evermanni]|uniref:Uncharacterized protein n=1 Tax=Porites evermanni TaxID=104178 RepID=A0ABN8MMC7_9CNID|nr:unnamed protein product [Porites evermanni]